MEGKTREELEAIAACAAELSGQKWDALPAHSKEVWVEAVRSVDATSSYQTPLYQCAADALHEALAPSKPTAKKAEANASPVMAEKAPKPKGKA